MTAALLLGSSACSDVDKGGPTAPEPPPPPQEPPPPPAPQLQYTRFLAFGDSLTYGVVSAAPTRRPYALGPDFSYPALLHGRLQQRYTDQTITVSNEGLGGERLRAGLVRLTNLLPAARPDVLLLMGGANNLSDCAHALASDQPGCVDNAVRTLDDLARQARLTLRADGTGFVVLMIATLPPQGENGQRASPALVSQFNQGVRDIARGEGGILVDVFAAFGGVADPTLIGPDGLHPTMQGYDVIAQTFFNAIIGQPGWETAPPSSPSQGALAAR
jgi:lysophospholipase L1-like esterase